MAVKIVVASGKGGVGKSSVSSGLCRSLASAGRRVLAIDCDIGLRSLDIFFGVSEKVVFDWGDLLMERCTADQALIRSGEGVLLLAAPASFDDEFTVEKFSALFVELEQSVDYIIFDSSAGISKSFKLASCCADMGLIVATPDEICVRGSAITAKELEKNGVNNIRLIINRFHKKKVAKGRRLNIDEVIDSSFVQLIGIVPEDEALAFSAPKGLPLPANSPSQSAFSRIVIRLEGGQIPLKLK